MMIKRIKLVDENAKEWEFKVKLNNRSMIAIERALKEEIDENLTFFSGSSRLAKEEIEVILIFVSNMLFVNNETYPIGMDFFDDNEISFMFNIQKIMSSVMEVISKSTAPTATKKK